MSDISQTADDVPLDYTRADAAAGTLTANWLAVFSLALGTFSSVTAEFLPISLLTPMAADLGVSVAAAGQAVTTTAIVGGLAGLLTAIVTQRFDRRYVLSGLMAILVVSNLIAATASSYWLLLFARVLLGISLGGFWSMVGATALRLVPEQSVPRAMSIVFGGVSAATVIAAPVGAYVGDLWGWRAAFLIAGGLSVVALALQLLALPRLAPKQTANLRSLAALGMQPRIAIGLGVILLVISGHFAGFTYIRAFLEQTPAFDVQAVSLTLLAFGVAGFIGTAAAGPLMARSIRGDIALGAGLIALSGLGLLLYGATGWASIAIVTVWGFAFGLVPVGVQTWGVKAAPDDAEAIGALLVPGFQVAITLGAALGGVLVSGFGPSGAIVYAGLAALAGALVVLGSRKMVVS